MASSTAPPLLLQTKLHPPGVRPGSVERERLFRRLDDGAALPLTLLSSPAGSGKSTLVADWARSRGHRVAWLALDERDNDLQRFFAYAVAALQTIAPGAGADLLATLLGPEPLALELLLAALVNDIAERGELMLVLDDYHVIEAPAIHEALARLVEHPPPNLRLIVTTRVDPPLPLARLRARRRVAELRTADLRFTRDEAAAFLRDSMGLTLSREDVAALEERTEGWIVGLQMAALSLQGRDEVQSFVRDFTGSHRFVLDYLTEEVLARQDAETRRFLLEVSVLERLSGPLCDAIREAGASQGVLERLDAANLFLIPLDERREWFRFHHLFGTLLRHQLGRELGVDGCSALHRRAAAWFEEHRLFDEGIDHYLSAGLPDLAVDLVAREARGHLKRGDVATVRRWFQLLPAAASAARPRLAVDHAWLLALSLRWDEALAVAGSVDPEAVRSDAELALHFSTLHALLRAWYGSAAESLVPIEAVLAEVPQSDPLIAGILFQHLGILHRSLGNLEDAQTALERSLALHQAAGNLMSYMFSVWHLSGLAIARGRLAHGTALVVRAVAFADRVAQQGTPAPGAMATALVALAELSRERGDLETAERQVDESIANSRKAGVPACLVEGLLILSRIRSSRGRHDEALALIDEAAQVLRQSSERSFESLAVSYRGLYAGRAALHRGVSPPAELLLWARDETASRQPASGKGFMFSGADPEFHDLARARVLLAFDPAAADVLLRRVLERAEGRGLRRAAIEARLLLAIAADRGARQEADRTQSAAEETRSDLELQRALALAEDSGLAQVFADEAPLLRELLRRLDTPETAFSGRVLASCLTAPLSLAAPSPPGSPDRLSAREVEILSLIAGGLSNAAAGQRLFIAPSTVKKHLENIFGKLGARNRTQAVNEARRLGLLS